MEELGSMWSYHENIDELKQKLLYTTTELEILKVEAIEEIRKHKEDVKNLINLLKLAYHERDEAKDHLQKLLNKLTPSGPNDFHGVLPRAQPGSPLVLPAKANSSVTESSSLSDAYNHHSHGSSPVDSFLDAVSSPDFTTISVADSSQMGFANKPCVRDHKALVSTHLATAAGVKIDPADAIIENLAKGKVLPRNGELMKTVMRAGPLLKTLLVAGPLPTWRNPPPPLQPFRIPPVSIKGHETSNISCQKPAAIADCDAKKPSISQSYAEMSRGSCSASVLNFAREGSCSGLGNGWLLNSGGINQIGAAKRQRLQ